MPKEPSLRAVPAKTCSDSRGPGPLGTCSLWRGTTGLFPQGFGVLDSLICSIWLTAQKDNLEGQLARWNDLEQEREATGIVDTEKADRQDGRDVGFETSTVLFTCRKGRTDEEGLIKKRRQRASSRLGLDAGEVAKSLRLVPPCEECWLATSVKLFPGLNQGDDCPSGKEACRYPQGLNACLRSGVVRSNYPGFQPSMRTCACDFCRAASSCLSLLVHAPRRGHISPR